MYRSRIGVWIVGLVVCIIISIFGDINFSKETYTIYSNTTDIFLKNNFAQNTFLLNANASLNKSNADIIIQTSSNEKIEGYDKYEDYLYSPIVMFANSACQDDKSGFIIKNHATYFDLKKLLIGLEKNQTFKDIGINKKVAEGSIAISIPDESNESYNEVRKLFLLTLSDGDEISEKIENRVDNILEKCRKVSDPMGEMIKITKNKSDHNLIFIGPEYYVKGDIHESVYVFNWNKKTAWYSIYPNKTCNIIYDVFVKKNKEDIFGKIKKKYTNLGLRSYDKPTIYSDYTPNNIVVFDEK